MTGADAVDLLQSAIFVAIVASAPVILAAAGVGIVVALFQALTQIQEMTLTFVPKILAVMFMLALSASFIGMTLEDFARHCFTLIEGTRQ